MYIATPAYTDYPIRYLTFGGLTLFLLCLHRYMKLQLVKPKVVSARIVILFSRLDEEWEVWFG